MLGYTLTTVVMTCWRGWSIGPHPPSGWPHHSTSWLLVHPTVCPIDPVGPPRVGGMILPKAWYHPLEGPSNLPPEDGRTLVGGDILLGLVLRDPGIS